MTSETKLIPRIENAKDLLVHYYDRISDNLFTHFHLMFQFLMHLNVMTEIGPSCSILLYRYLRAKQRSIVSPALIKAINIPIIQKKFFLALC